jgi:hypothetical protein
LTSGDNDNLLAKGASRQIVEISGSGMGRAFGDAGQIR